MLSIGVNITETINFASF